MYPLKSSSDRGSRSPQTCEWLLDHPEYKAWTLEPQGLLWVRGKPGSGKSTLMNFAVESSKKQSRDFLVAAFFFHGQAKGLSLRRSMLGLLRSLLHQLLKQSTSLCAKFHAAYRSKREQEGLEREPPERCDWQLAELQDFFLEEVANAQDVPAIRIFVDAMDESRRDENGGEASEDIVKFLELLSSGVGRCPIGVCASSRHYLVTQPSHGRQIRVEDSNTKDISLHVQMELQNCQYISRDLREEIVTASANIFLWARLVTRQVVILYRNTLNKGTITRLVRETLLKSKTLDDVFKNILYNLQEAGSSQTIHLMRFVCFAERPFSSRELRSALNFEEAMSLSPEEVPEALDTTETIEFLSGGLVEFQKQDEEYVAQFIHQTVKEFLEQEGFKILDVSIPPAKVIGNAHRDLSINCAKYLSNEAVHNRRTYQSSEELLSDFPFLNYAIHSVFIHAEAADAKGSLEEEAREFLTLFKRDKSYSFWVSMYRTLYPYSSRCPESDSTFLHMVSAYNISSCARLLLADLNGGSIDVRDNLKRTALHWAASEGNDPILNLLLENRPPADIEAKDKYERTPLHMACYAGRKDMVEKLLLSGAYIEQQEMSGWRPLHRAVDGGHESVVKLLLEKNADIEAKDSSECNALLRAAKWNHGSILQLLLEKGANVKAAANSRETALHAAASRGNETNVRLLLERGAEVDAKMEDGKTPLFFAAEKGWVDVTRYLLSKSANAKATMPRGETPLHFAASFGHFQVADLLVRSGADVTARAVYGGTPLHAAAYGGYEKTVALLLRSGADVSAKMDDGETPLDEAGVNGSIKRMLENWTNTGHL
jgi:ankyrin repeat protein